MPFGDNLLDFTLKVYLFASSKLLTFRVKPIDIKGSLVVELMLLLFSVCFCPLPRVVSDN